MTQKNHTARSSRKWLEPKWLRIVCSKFLSSFYFSHFVHISYFEYLGELFPPQRILLVYVLVLVEIQHIRVVRPVIPIFEPKLVAEAH